MKLDTGPGGIAKEQANGLYGIRWVGIGVGLIILVSALAPMLFCKDSKSEHHENKVSFREALVFTRRNKAFWPLVIVTASTPPAKFAESASLTVADGASRIAAALFL